MPLFTLQSARHPLRRKLPRLSALHPPSHPLLRSLHPRNVATTNHVRDNLQSADVHPPPRPPTVPSRRRSIFTSPPARTYRTLRSRPPLATRPYHYLGCERRAGGEAGRFCSVLWKIITFSKAVTVTVSSGKSKYSLVQSSRIFLPTPHRPEHSFLAVASLAHPPPPSKERASKLTRTSVWRKAPFFFGAGRA